MNTRGITADWTIYSPIQYVGHKGCDCSWLVHSLGSYATQRCRLILSVYEIPLSWWRHQMETFSALLALCAGNSAVPGEFPAQRPVTRSFDVFFDLRLNKRLSKQSWGWWFETQSGSLWRHCNVEKRLSYDRTIPAMGFSYSGKGASWLLNQGPDPYSVWCKLQFKRPKIHYGDIIIKAMASNHRRLDCLFNRLFGCRSKKTSKLRVVGLCERNPPIATG